MQKKIKFLIAMGIVPLVFLYWPAMLGGDTNYIITYGASMLPTILHGSMVITKAEQQYFVDDIVSFTQHEEGVEKIIVHRIIKEVEGGFTIKGDNNPRPDPGVIPPDDINGKVVVALPYIGYSMEILRNPLAMIVIAVALMAVQSDLKRRKQQKSRKRKKLEDKLPKKDFGLFYGALVVNLISYLIIQYSLSAQYIPKVDMLTAILWRTFLPSFASTLAFALYFIAIIAIYYYARIYHPEPQIKKSSRGGTMLLQQSNTVMAGAQMFWIMFIMIGIINLVATVQEPEFVFMIEDIIGFELPFYQGVPQNPAISQLG